VGEQAHFDARHLAASSPSKESELHAWKGGENIALIGVLESAETLYLTSCRTSATTTDSSSCLDKTAQAINSHTDQ
jgi:hypothetical protein